jgi:hypothetical protein
MRLPDCPKVTKHGHDVAAWKAYIVHRAEKIQNQAGTRSKLQIDLLQARLARESHELDVARGAVREEIIREIGALFNKGFAVMTIRLDRLPQELAPQLVGISSPGDIKKMLKAKLADARREACTEFESYLRDETDKKPD